MHSGAISNIFYLVAKYEVFHLLQLISFIFFSIFSDKNYVLSKKWTACAQILVVRVDLFCLLFWRKITILRVFSPGFWLIVECFECFVTFKEIFNEQKVMEI